MYQQKHLLESEISERIRTQETLEQNISLLNTLFRSIPDIVYYKSPEGVYLACNRTFEQSFGITETQIISKTDRDIFSAELVSEHERLDQEVISTNSPVEKEFWVKLADGRNVLLDYRLNPIFNSSGKLTGIIGIARDTTERYLDKKALQQARDDADAANLAKSMFLANMSHEIRTPMNGIIGMTDILMGTPLNPEQIEFMQIIKLSGDNLLTIINDILDFSKIEAGKISLEKINFSLVEKINETLMLLSLNARKKGLYLTSTVAANIPPLINGDPLRTKQILINLISNAIKFTCEGGVNCDITLQEKMSGSFRLLFRIRDTGPGISTDGQTKLFQSFSQSDSSISRKFGGTGLGLTISKRLVELMNGEIGVESEEGKGSTFWFTAEFGQPLVLENIEQADVDLPDEGKKLKILLAEDNPVNQRVAIYNLTRLGHKVDIAENGQEAVAMGIANRYSIILMDIQMPVMSGIEATHGIRQWEKTTRQAREIPIIAMTAEALIGDMENFLAEGMNGYISKPFKMKDLINVLKLAR
jgi:PAS domain S-box-containing protein